MVEFKILKDLNKTILSVNVVFLIAVITYSIIATPNSLIPKPIFFIGSTIFSIFICLCVWLWQDTIDIDFERKNANKPVLERDYNDPKYNAKINWTYAISIFCFFIPNFIAFILQLTK